MLTALKSAGNRALRSFVSSSPAVAANPNAGQRLKDHNREASSQAGDARGQLKRSCILQHCSEVPPTTKCPHRANFFEVCYVAPTLEDDARILDFLQRTFFRHEPTMVATGLSGRTPDIMLHMYKQALREDMSVLAVDINNDCEILGVAINGKVEKYTDSKELRSLPAKSEEVRKILDLWAYLLDRPEGWPEDVTTMLELKAVATHPKAARTGIAANLSQISRLIAKKCGYSGLRMECTSLYTKKAADKIKLPEAFCMRYKDYLNERGLPVFRTPAPHTEIVVYVDHFVPPDDKDDSDDDD